MGCEDLTELCVGQGISAPTLLGWWLCPRGGGGPGSPADRGGCCCDLTLLSCTPKARGSSPLAAPKPRQDASRERAQREDEEVQEQGQGRSCKYGPGAWSWVRAGWAVWWQGELKFGVGGCDGDDEDGPAQLPAAVSPAMGFILAMGSVCLL